MCRFLPSRSLFLFLVLRNLKIQKPSLLCISPLEPVLCGAMIPSSLPQNMTSSSIKMECAFSSTKPERCGVSLVKPETNGDVNCPSNQQTPQKSEWRETTARSDKSSTSPVPSAATPNDRQSSWESKPSVPPTEDIQTKPQPDELQPTTQLQLGDSILTSMVISLENRSFSLLFSIARLFVRIPFRVFKFLAAIMTLRVMWLFLADDNGAWEIGARVDHRYNMPGIY